jgi:hypothetical protein
MGEQAADLHPELSKRLEATLLDAEPALRRLAGRLCGNSVDARDLLQDTFERAVRQGIRPEIRSPGAWLSTITRKLPAMGAISPVCSCTRALSETLSMPRRRRSGKPT